MATVPVKKADGWVVASAVSCNYQNDSNLTLRYDFSELAPAGKGMSMPPLWLDAVELTGTTKMWVKNENETVINFEVSPWAQ